MDSIFTTLATPTGRAIAWIDSLFIDHALLRLLWHNTATVTPGQLYRSNHPTPAQLARLTARHHLHTVINLRGATRSGSDALSREQAHKLGLTVLDIPLSSGHPPTREGMQRLIQALKTARRPILLHCKSGADRSGFAAAIDLILQGAPVATAIRQLTWRHGHLARSRAGILDAFLLTYRRQAESCKPFEDWLANDYDEAALRKSFAATGLAHFLQAQLLRRE